MVNFAHMKNISDLACNLGLSLGSLLLLQRTKHKHYRKKMDVKNGKKRLLYKPKPEFKKLLRKVKELLSRYKFPDCVQGGVKGRSPITNAESHLRKRRLLKHDVRKFFPSVKPQHVYVALASLGFRANVAKMITELCTADHHLPQGFPTSTVLANLVFARADKRLLGLAKAHGLIYTRYIDDITFSGNRISKAFEEKVARIIREQGLRLRRSKRELKRTGEEMVVTGVRVDKGKDVPTGYFEQVKNEVKEKKRWGQVEPILMKRWKGKIAYIKSLSKQKSKEIQKMLNSN